MRMAFTLLLAIVTYYKVTKLLFLTDASYSLQVMELLTTSNGVTHYK